MQAATIVTTLASLLFWIPPCICILHATRALLSHAVCTLTAISNLSPVRLKHALVAFLFFTIFAIVSYLILVRDAFLFIVINQLQLNLLLDHALSALIIIVANFLDSFDFEILGNLFLISAFLIDKHALLWDLFNATKDHEGLCVRQVVTKLKLFLRARLQHLLLLLIIHVLCWVLWIQGL